MEQEEEVSGAALVGGGRGAHTPPVTSQSPGGVGVSRSPAADCSNTTAQLAKSESLLTFTYFRGVNSVKPNASDYVLQYQVENKACISYLSRSHWYFARLVKNVFVNQEIICNKG